MSVQILCGDEGERALAAASAEKDLESLATVARLRDRFGGELAAAALTQVALRRSGRAKLGALADALLLTRDGLEQATRLPVSQWRAERLRTLGVTEIWDLGCGIAADARALADAGIAVTAVEIDPETAAVAAHNLGDRGRVLTGDATTVDVPDGVAIFLDPARRDSRGRTWDPARLSPSWDFVTQTLASGRTVCAKLGPGLPHALIPDGVLAEWVSHRGDVVECSLWAGPGVERGRAATLIVDDGTHRLVEDGRYPLAVDAPAAWLAEPDGAAIRAGLVPQIAAEIGAHALAAGVAYLSADEPTPSPWLTWFEVLEVLPYDEKVLRQWAAAKSVGTLEIKKRGIDVDPAALRKKLKPKGKASATFVLTPTVDGARALVVRRLV